MSSCSPNRGTRMLQHGQIPPRVPHGNPKPYCEERLPGAWELGDRINAGSVTYDRGRIYRGYKSGEQMHPELVRGVLVSI